MPLHSTLLKYVVAVAEHGSIRDAARAMNISSSSITRHIINLETELGIRLFDRHKKGVRVTAAGDLLVSHARRTVKEFDQVAADIMALKGLEAGNVSVACVPSLVPTVLPDIVHEYHRKHPGVSFQIRVMSSRAVIEALLHDDADIGLCYFSGQVHGIREHAAVNVRIVATTLPRSEIARYSSISLTELIDIDLIIPSKSLSTRTILDRFFVKHKLFPRIIVQCDSIALIKTFVCRGMGIGIQPEIALEPELSEKRLVALAINDPDLEMDRVGIVTNERRYPSVATGAFIECSRRVMEQQISPL